MIPDQKLTDNFSLYELTGTSHEQFLEQNRNVSASQIEKLKEVATLLEEVREILTVPLIVTSGYRCPKLNTAVGSTPASQHMLCEASDFIPLGIDDLGEAFRKLWNAIKDENLKVGQLIHETAPRGYGYTSWIHISLGLPYREKFRCNQILRMENGVYRFLDFPIKNV